MLITQCDITAYPSVSESDRLVRSWPYAAGFVLLSQTPRIIARTILRVGFKQPDLPDP